MNYPQKFRHFLGAVSFLEKQIAQQVFDYGQYKKSKYKLSIPDVYDNLSVSKSELEKRINNYKRFELFGLNPLMIKQ